MSAEDLYRSYQVDSYPIRLLFRDHALSDRIGFTYQSWPADAAAADFLSRVRNAGQLFASTVRTRGSITKMAAGHFSAPCTIA